MDCGVPFCHTGIADQRDGLRLPDQQPDPRVERPRLPGPVAGGDRSASTGPNNFPEFTGRVCPAPCEGSCTVGIDGDPVDDQDDRAGDRRPRVGRGLDHAEPAARADRADRRGRRQRAGGPRPRPTSSTAPGTSVTVYERAGRIGGLLMYGIPNMKLDKDVVARRDRLMAEEGVRFVTGVTVGADVVRGPAARRARRRGPGDRRHRRPRPGRARAASWAGSTWR